MSPTIPFGEHVPSRWGADIRYTGTAGEHNYVVEVRHRLLDTSAEVLIDGVRHVPKQEKSSAKAPKTDGVTTDDGIAVRWSDGLSLSRMVVRRPTVDGTMKDRETIEIRTAGFGGSGEVDVRLSSGTRSLPLAPEKGSASEARESRKAEHPTRYAMIVAAVQAAKYLIPILGFGALFSGLLDPVKQAVARWIRPVTTWIGEVTRPVREVISAILEPIGAFFRWLLGILFGWVPDFDLPIPEWVFEFGVPILLVVLAFVTAAGRIRRRREKLAAASGGSTGAKDPEREPDPEADPTHSPGVER